MTHWGSVFSSPSAGSCTSSNSPSNQETLVPLEKHDHPAACPSHSVEDQHPAPLAMVFITRDPSAAWATRKGPRSCHCLKEPGEAAGNYTHISWSWFYNKTSHLNSLINDGQPGFRKRSSRLANWPEFSRGPSARVHTQGESISWETHKTFTKLHGRLMSHMQQTTWTVGTRERRYFSISWRLATARKRESG